MAQLPPWVTVKPSQRTSLQEIGSRTTDPARVLRRGDGGISLDAAGADDAGVIHVGRVNERATPRLPAAFPANVHHRIIRRVGAADDDAVLFQAEDGAVAHLHAADEISARRHEDVAAAGDGAGIERLLKGDGVLVRAVADGAEVADVIRLRRRHGLCWTGRHRAARQNRERGQDAKPGAISFHLDFRFWGTGLL